MNISNLTAETSSSSHSNSDTLFSPSTIVVMGDALSGKSTLIKSLSSDKDQRLFRLESNNDIDDNVDRTIFGGTKKMERMRELRLLEFHTGYEDSVEPDDVALVIITFDLRVHESFHAAMNKWCKIKDERMNESGLVSVLLKYCVCLCVYPYSERMLIWSMHVFITFTNPSIHPSIH